ncbi:MAG TPA: cytochrome P450 [Solirubrobacteraceae bacterium]|jgi:cytochrome P450|nr:cytochrome P450 [Solirubrobacteraceae bacterium]
MSTTAITQNIASLMGELATPAGQADPYPIYRRMHALGEAVDMPDGTVVVTGYRASSSVIRDNRLRKSPGAVLTAAGYPDWERRPSLSMLFGSMLMLNAPQHTRLRRLVSRSFTAQRVARMREAITRLADELCEPLSGTIEFVDSVAFPFPVTVIGELLGIPAADRPMFQPLVREWTSVLEILNPLAVDSADGAAVQIRSYLHELVRERRARPDDDLISALVAVEDDEHQLDEEELVTMAALILAAGFETTTGLLANGFLTLLGAPHQADRLRREPALAKPAIEELLRYDAPVQILYGRTATEDMIVGDLPVAAGRRLINLLGAANRDPRQFSEPDELRLDRDEGPGLSFGGGIHHCLGAALARLEAQVMLPALLDRFPRAALVGEPVRRSGLMIRGYTSLRIALDG